MAFLIDTASNGKVMAHKTPSSTSNYTTVAFISWIWSFQHDLKTMLNWSLGEGLEMLYINSLRVKITWQSSM